MTPLWEERGWTLTQSTEWKLALCELLGPSLTLLSDGVKQAEPFFACPDLADDAYQQQEGEGERVHVVYHHLGPTLLSQVV